MAEDALRRGALHEAGHAVVARVLGLTVIKIELLGDDGKGRIDTSPDDHLSRDDQLTLAQAGRASEVLFGFDVPEASRDDYAKMIMLLEGLPEAESLRLRKTAYLRAEAIVKSQMSEVERLANRLVEVREI